MADLKISALPAASTPLAGTEIVPVVQGGTTDQVSVANLTAGRAVDTGALKATAQGANVGNTGNALSVQRTANDSQAYLGFRTTPDAWVLSATYSSTGAYKPIIVATSDLARLTVATGGDVTVNTGNLVIGTSGKGIDFSATSGAGTSELLADYEEGTWTPVIAGQSSAGIGVYTAQVGRYTKVGRAVHFTAYVTWTAHTGTGTMVLNGLPFTSDTTSNVFYSFSPFNGNLTHTANYQIALVLFNNSTTLTFYEMNNGVAAGQINIDTAADIIVSGTYFV